MSEPRVTRLAAPENERRARVLFPRDWPVFSGHFPGRPIVPGAEVLDLAVTLSGRGLAEVERLTFHASIGPGDTIEIHLRLAGVRADLTVTRAGERCAAGRLRLTGA